jgi:branched-chain amino acid transport system substrate-binding protein
VRAALAILLALACLGAVAGCGSSSDGDPQLTIYLSAPLSGPRSADGRDVVDGAKLALADAGGAAAGTAVSLKPLDDATGNGWDGAATGANARTASQDSTTIAYIGELDSGASRTSIPITNEAGILQVSPGSGAEDLTRDALGSSGIPDVQPSGSRTFGRVIPSDRDQGEAAAGWMSRLGVTSVQFLAGDTAFADSLRSGLEAAPDAPAIVAGDQSPDAAYDAQDDPFSDSEPGLLPKTKGPVFGSDALLDPGDRASLRILRRSCERPRLCPSGGREIHLTSAALDPSQLPPAAAEFLADFRNAYGREPGRYAAYGYEAAALALDSIGRADDPLDRSAVVDAFFQTSDRESILGTYSIDEVGNTSLGELGAYDVAGDLTPKPDSEPLELP